MSRLDAYFVAVVFAHLVAVLVHTAAHLGLQIVPPPPDIAFILGVILIGPVATLPILRFSQPLASGVLAVLMVAAFAYGFLSHFVIAGPDQVSIVASDPWTFVFAVTAVTIGMIEILGVGVAVILFRRATRNPWESRGRRG